jgi:hypothetical protein
MALRVSTLLVLPLASALGVFAGGCLGASGGEWLEFVGVAQATAWGTRIGLVLGMILCPGYVVQRVIRDERAAVRNPPGTGDDLIL